MDKLICAQEAVKRIKDGDWIMIGGFLKGGKPQKLVEALNKTSAKDLTLIANDSGTETCATYELIKSGRVKRIMASYIGANPESGRLLMTNEADVQLIPQGTLAERIRAGGAGLGGVLTPVGIGTVVEEGKVKLEIKNKEYLLEMPIRAHVALIKANKADTMGNLVINGSARNFNVIMATAADYVIAEVDEVVEAGEIDPNHVVVPGILVDAIVKVGGCNE